MTTDFIHIAPENNDIPLVASTFNFTMGEDQYLVRLVPEALVPAEKLALGTLGLELEDSQPVGFVPKRAIGFPAWAILSDPDNAHHALNLVADIEWARRNAKNQAGNVKKRIDNLYTVLQSSAPHFLPTFLEEVARIFAGVDNNQYAKQYFGKAREVERAHGIAVDPDRHEQAFMEFAALGVVGARELTAEATDAMTRMEPAAALDYFENLIIERAKHGTEAYGNALRDLKRLGKLAGKTPKEVDVSFVAKYVPTQGFTSSSEGLLKKLLPLLKDANELNPEVGQALISSCPQIWQIDEYITALQQAGVWEELTADSEQFAEWFITLFNSKSHYYYFNISNKALLATIEKNASAFKDVTFAFTLHNSPSTNLDYYDVLIAAGATITLDPDNWYEPELEFDEWFATGSRDLSFVLSDETMTKLLLAGLSAYELEKHLDKLLSFEPTTKFVSQWLDTFVVQKHQAIGCHGHSAGIHEQRDNLQDPRLKQLNPDAIADIFHLNVAEDFAERIRRGTLVEYTWPAFEKAAASFKEPENNRYIGAFPVVAVVNGSTVIVVDGEQTETITLPAKTRADHIFKVGDQYLIIYEDLGSYNDYYFWSNEGVGHKTQSRWYYRTSDYVQEIDGALHVGPTIVEPDMPTPAPSQFGGAIHGTGPYYVTDGNYRSEVSMWPESDPAFDNGYQAGVIAGTLPGLDTSFLDFSQLPENATLHPTNSFYQPVTETTKNSPFGVHNGCIVGFQFSMPGPRYSSKQVWCSPLGYFSNDKSHNFQVIRRPGGGVWFVKARQLMDAETRHTIHSSLDGNGANALLCDLPLVGYHQLIVRNEKASAAMRQCTVEQAQRLIDHPTEILDFVHGDEVLAAAVAGMLTQICQVSPTPVPIADLPQTPHYLQAYSQLKAPASTTTNTLPDPPQLSGDAKKYFSWLFDIHAYYIAHSLTECRSLVPYFSDPSPGERIPADSYVSFAQFISQEKRILAKLAAPAIPVPALKELVALFSWLAEIGWLGKLHAAACTEAKRAEILIGQWHDKCLMLWTDRNDLIAAWNPEQVKDPKATLGELWVKGYTSTFLPKEDFLAQLQAILTWREGMTEEQLVAVFSLLAQPAEALAKATSLPPGSWQLALSGLTPKNTYSETFTTTDAKLLGIKTPMLKALYKQNRVINKQLDTILAAAWHENYLTDGPNIEAAIQAWRQEFGQPWIHLTDQDADFLCRQPNVYNRRHLLYQEKLPTDDIVRSDHQVFRMFVSLTQLVEPQSESAKELVRRIELFRNYQPPKNTIALGGSYEDAEKGGWVEEHAPRALLEGHLDALLEYLKTGNKPTGSSEDPQHSAPETVQAVSTELGISEDAARYFLQILSLAHPTDTQVKKWNGWQKRKLDAVVAELVEAGLVVQAKRAGANRAVFLPGGWLGKSPTGPAMETWKAPHYLLWKAETTRPVIPGCPPLMPFGELFAETWARYASGDKPGYEELRTSRYQRRRR